MTGTVFDGSDGLAFIQSPLYERQTTSIRLRPPGFYTVRIKHARDGLTSFTIGSVAELENLYSQFRDVLLRTPYPEANQDLENPAVLYSYEPSNGQLLLLGQASYDLEVSSVFNVIQSPPRVTSAFAGLTCSKTMGVIPKATTVPPYVARYPVAIYDRNFGRFGSSFTPTYERCEQPRLVAPVENLIGPYYNYRVHEFGDRFEMETIFPEMEYLQQVHGNPPITSVSSFGYETRRTIAYTSDDSRNPIGPYPPCVDMSPI